MLHGAVQQFMRDVEWGELDYLVVDLPPGTGDVSLSMAQSVPVAGAVVVTTPQGVSVSDVRKAVGDVPPAQHPRPGRGREHELLRLRPLRRAHRDLRPRRRRERMAEDMGIPFLGEVPDRHPRALGRRRGPADRGRRSRLAGRAQAFVDVAGKVAAQISIQDMRVLRVIQTA